MSSELPRLKVSENRRFLVTEDGSPFFWMADTAWCLRKITPGDIDLYLANRAQHRFNVVQVYCGHSLNTWISAADLHGNWPFLEDDTDRPNEPFWRDTMDAIVSQAREHGVYIALVPMWGMEYAPAFGSDAQKAYRLGKWLGARYASQSHVLWIASGEYDAVNRYVIPISAEQRSLFAALGQGLHDGHDGTQLTTVHPGKAFTSSLDFRHEPWLDFNMLQTGHEDDREAYGNPEVYTTIEHDYGLTPTKPVLDGEPFYEDILDGFHVDRDMNRPRGGADVVRRKAYWSIFAGACGHTYGHNDVQVFQEEPLSHPVEATQRHVWKGVLEAPGAVQMKHLRALMESQPLLNRIPDQSLLASPAGTGLRHVRATRGEDGSYALVYLPAGGAVTVRLEKLAGPDVKGSWFDPRTGASSETGVYPATGTTSFHAPGEPGLGNDWVLVLESFPERQQEGWPHLSLSGDREAGLTSHRQPECCDPRVGEEPPVNAPNDSPRGAVRSLPSVPAVDHRRHGTTYGRVPPPVVVVLREVVQQLAQVIQPSDDQHAPEPFLL